MSEDEFLINYLPTKKIRPGAQINKGSISHLVDIYLSANVANLFEIL